MPNLVHYISLITSILYKPLIYRHLQILTNAFMIEPPKNHLKLHLRPINYEDPRGMVEKIPEGYQWTLDRRVYLKSKEDATKIQ